ncbi:hypothetical protein F0562_013673 [Nyssa sinensis]|uniref:Pentacotripeptide-repeat region of PRORP domain-containing protein n=1 Tax=Nyssa sinensis TaxID=561372 RepID=A0A5J4ZPN9_9ASTE|nr:hypothetical protein F0562_013673 [Nyssa sinensis]
MSLVCLFPFIERLAPNDRSAERLQLQSDMLRSQLSRRLINRFPPKFKLFTTTQTQPPNSFSSLLDLCNNPQHLQQIHARFILHGLHQNATLASKLIDTYASLGRLCVCRQVFNSITKPNTALYNTFLRSLYKFGEFKKTLLVYQEMVLKSMYQDEHTYPFVLRSCSQLSNVENGKKIHGHVVKLGFDSFDLVGNALVDMFREFGNSGNVHELIEKKPVDSAAYWNSLIFEASRKGEPEEGFRIFKRMRMERVEPDSVSVINLLRASVDLNSLKAGKLIHCLIVVTRLCEDLAVNTALLTMYSKMGSLEDARLLFEKMSERDCVVWNLMISGYSRNGFPMESLEMLMQMVRSGIRADLFTALAAISSIAELKSLKGGKQMHAHVIRNGSNYQVSVHNCLIDMYCKCNCLIAAQKIFDLVTDKSEVSWSSIIRGYGHWNT